MSKQLFKDAIADAKTVRDTALMQAKLSLEEHFTPHLQSMLAAKLQEMEAEDDEVIDESNMEETIDINSLLEDDDVKNERTKPFRKRKPMD